MSTKLKNIFRCYAMGMGLKSIACAFHLSRNTVRKYVRSYQESGISLENLLKMSEEHLQDIFSVRKERESSPSARQIELEALLPEYARRLSRKGVTAASLYEEYAGMYPDGYKSTHFKTLLRRYLFQVKVVGHVEHPAGDQMYIDYAGESCPSRRSSVRSGLSPPAPAPLWAVSMVTTRSVESWNGETT